MQPRLIRFRDAPRYLGMDRNRFNVEVRPRVTEVRIGHQGVAFDRLELDAWVDEYLARNGRPAQKGAISIKGYKSCAAFSMWPRANGSTNTG